MLRALGMAILVALACLAQGKVKFVTFHSEPPDAQVVLEVSGTAPFVLGKCGQPLPLDLALFEGRQAVKLTFQRAGWLDETRELQKEGSQTHFFSTRDRYPDQSQGPVRLTPKTDPASRLLQARLFLASHALGLGVGALGCGLVLAAVGLGLARVRERSRRLTQLESQRATLDTTDKLVFTELGNYRLLDQLGEGGMGAVYRAVPKDTMAASEAVAIKILDKNLSLDPEARKRFEREVQISKQLVHPNIVRLIDWGEQDGLLYMVMELLEGGPLYKSMPKEGMDLARAVAILTPLARGLQEAHNHGVVHRDLKPGNIFVLKNGGLKILDFGIARGHNFTVATATGQAMGTPAYMAPEQLLGELDTRSDQYAVGVLLFEMLSGMLPFKDSDPFVLAMQHVNRPPPKLGPLRPDLPAEVEQVVMRMLHKNPDQRFASVEEAAAAFASAAGGR